MGLVVLAACGKRGDPHPPVPVIPRATSDLVVAQQADKVVLSWSYPSLTTAGRNLTAIRRVVVYRHVADPVAPTAALTSAQFARVATRLQSIEGAELPAATEGAKLTFTDQPPMGRRVTYAVVTEGMDARSDLSNLEAITPLDVAQAPSGLKAIVTPQAVVLEWPAPQKSTSGSSTPVLAGYNVYRGETLLTPKPITETRYSDTPAYGEHEYRVTAVGSAGPPLIESLPSPVATANFRDLIPPPVPQNVSALVETKIVRLLWDAVDAPDLAGYNVYRYEPPYKLKMMTLKTTFFGDESVQPGVHYTYAVTAIDANGNESAEAKANVVMVPKVPR